MSCSKKIKANIVADCTTQGLGGIEQTIYLINREDIGSITRDTTVSSKITTFTLTSPAKAYKLIGQKQNLTWKSERQFSDTMADSWKHSIGFHAYKFDAESTDNIDEMQDLVAIVERKDKSNTDGTFIVLGLGTGLFTSSDTTSSSENNGVRVLEMASLDSQLERESWCTLVMTDYATTKAFLEGLC